MSRALDPLRTRPRLAQSWPGRDSVLSVSGGEIRLALAECSNFKDTLCGDLVNDFATLQRYCFERFPNRVALVQTAPLVRRKGPPVLPRAFSFGSSGEIRPPRGDTSN